MKMMEGERKTPDNYWRIELMLNAFKITIKTNNKSRILINKGTSIKSRQGNSLSLMLFNLIINQIIEVKEGTKWDMQTLQTNHPK